MISDNLYEDILKLPKKNILHLMLESLDYMQQYNGRTITDCIMLSIDGKLNENNDQYSYEPKKMKRMTEHCLL